MNIAFQAASSMEMKCVFKNVIAAPLFELKFSRNWAITKNECVYHQQQQWSIKQVYHLFVLNFGWWESRLLGAVTIYLSEADYSIKNLCGL